jgi:hypothetical protein
MPPVEMPLPSPWLLGLATVAAGLVLWWSTPDMVRREEQKSRFVLGRLSPFARWPEGTRAFHAGYCRFGSAVITLAGVAILVHAAAGG